MTAKKLAVLFRFDGKQLTYLGKKWSPNPLEARVFPLEEALQLLRNSRTMLGVFAWPADANPPFMEEDHDAYR